MSGTPAISGSTQASGIYAAGRVAPVEAATVCPPRRVCCDHYCRVDRVEGPAGFIPYSDYITAQNARNQVAHAGTNPAAAPTDPPERDADLPRISDAPPPNATRDVQVYEHVTRVERTMPSGSLLDVLI